MFVLLRHASINEKILMLLENVFQCMFAITMDIVTYGVFDIPAKIIRYPGLLGTRSIL